MTEHINVSSVSQAGVGHTDDITGGRIDCTCPETTAVIRVYNGDKLTAVHTITGVSRMLWEPDGHAVTPSETQHPEGEPA